MVLRTILSFYDTRDGIQTHTYSSALVILLLIWNHGLLLVIHRDEVVHSDIQELIVLQLCVIILLIIIIITQVHSIISLDVFTFLLKVLQLGLLGLDGLLQGCDPCAKAGNDVVLLGAGGEVPCAPLQGC